VRPKRLGHIIAAAATALTVVIFAAPGVAYAATSGDSPSKLAAISGHNTLNHRPPVTYLRVGQKTDGPSPNVTGNGSYIAGSQYYWICPHNGSCGNLYDSFYTSATGIYYIDFGFGVQCHLWNSTVYADWLGSSPYNASYMAVSSTAWVGGVSISASYAGITGSVSGGGSSLTFSHGYGPTWQIETAFNSVYFTSYIAMWGPYQNETGTADFTWQQFNDVIG
jgi:hypothetical protein